MSNITIIIIVIAGIVLSIGGSWFVSSRERKKIVEGGKSIGKSKANTKQSEETIKSAEEQINTNEDVIKSAENVIKEAEKIREKANNASSSD